MHIAFNLAAMDPSYRGGVNSYIQGLLGGFRALDRDDFTITLVCLKANQHLVEEFTEDARFILKVLPNRSPLKKLWRALAVLTQLDGLFVWSVNRIWNDVMKACDDAGDVIYTPTLVLNCFGAQKPTVISMHDLQHLHYPQYFPLHQRMNRDLYFNATARFATRIQASSEFIREDVMVHFPAVVKEHIPVISEGVDIQLFADAPAPSKQEIRDTYDLPEDFLFYPAQLWPHKNHLTILRALGRLRERGEKVTLVLTGARFGAAREIFDCINQQGLVDQVRYLGVVPFNDLIGIYRAARYLIIGALYESNSLPILESAAAGTPVIASDTPPNRELTADLKLTLFPPTDADALADIIHDAMQVDGSGSASHNSEGIQAYRWDTVAGKYLSLFESIV